VDLIVLAGASQRALDLGPGHLSESSLPGGPGNTVIAGRDDSWSGFLRELEPGDPIVLETPRGERHLYTVIGMDVVDSRRGSLVLDTETPMLSLVTRYPFEPYGANESMRYVVTAKMLF
jgi:sortase A